MDKALAANLVDRLGCNGKFVRIADDGLILLPAGKNKMRIARMLRTAPRNWSAKAALSVLLGDFFDRGWSWLFTEGSLRDKIILLSPESEIFCLTEETNCIKVLYETGRLEFTKFDLSV